MRPFTTSSLNLTSVVIDPTTPPADIVSDGTNNKNKNTAGVVKFLARFASDPGVLQPSQIIAEITGYNATPNASQATTIIPSSIPAGVITITAGPTTDDRIINVNLKALALASAGYDVDTIQVTKVGITSVGGATVTTVPYWYARTKFNPAITFYRAGTAITKGATNVPASGITSGSSANDVVLNGAYLTFTEPNVSGLAISAPTVSMGN